MFATLLSQPSTQSLMLRTQAPVRAGPLWVYARLLGDEPFHRMLKQFVRCVGPGGVHGIKPDG